MSDIPVCQNCGKKLYMNYGQRGILATSDRKNVWLHFNTEQERDAHEIPENAFNIERNSWGNNRYSIDYYIPQEERHGLFHSQYCFYQWHENHRNEIERLIKDMGEWKNPT